jgi:hypothetical protein
MQQLMIDVDGLKFLSPFTGKDMQETPFPFMKSLLLHVPTYKMLNLLDIYNTYIEEVSFYGLTMRSRTLERYPMCRG